MFLGQKADLFRRFRLAWSRIAVMRIAVALAIGGWRQGWRAPPRGTQLFFGSLQDYSLVRDVGTQDSDLGLQPSQLRIVPRHHELSQEDQKQRECQFHLAGLHYGV